ncbi:hypothetical protein LINGRAHAP2_LOCUS23146 [Linum grandiflorum]
MYIGRRTKLLTSLPLLATLCLLVAMRLHYANLSRWLLFDSIGGGLTRAVSTH